ncbi:death domain-associated protein 6 isoform X2 [Narcine bancroftii]|uniref:death domain-associated protein 6 isoform X2 n=1 Tax=Narcine bancroftii TaxID=1343680 RepID=UPI00383175AB
MALRCGGAGERPESGSADVVSLLSDDEGDDGGAETAVQAAASGCRLLRPRRVTLRPAGLGDSGPDEGQREHGVVSLENQRLFSEFVEFCGSLTEENPEVINFLQRKYSKAFPDYLASTEFRNVLGRCLTRVQGKKSKVFVYINELCTALKANSQKTKLALASKENWKHPLADTEGLSVGDTKEKEGCPERASASPEETASTSLPNPATVEKKRSGTGSRRQIRYLENLLKVYADEIKRLQQKELNLNELEDEDSSYIQEHRLKKKMVKIFEKLCELKNCSSLTGRVIEQRIPFTGTRYPEINRKVEKFINKPDHFPDYQDIRNIMHKVSTRHNLGLSQRQIQSMAQDVFREVGNRLQERRHLDLVYNFGSHLTDDYKPGKDPATLDSTLEKRLRQNRTIALGRLDEVIKKFAEIQDVGEIEEEEKRKRKKLQQSSTSSPAKEGGEGVKEEQDSTQKAEEAGEEEQKKEALEDPASEEEEDPASEEDEEDEDLSSEPDIEEELSKIEEVVEAEEEQQEDEKAEGSEVDETEVQSEDSLQSSDEESEEESESAEAQEGEASSTNESSTTCPQVQEPACSPEEECPAEGRVGSDSVVGPINAEEEGIGSSIEGSSIEGRSILPDEPVGSSSETVPVDTVQQDVGDDDARSPLTAKSVKEDSPGCIAREGIESSTDCEELKSEQVTRLTKRKQADSSEQKLVKTLPPSEAQEDAVTDDQKVVNSVSVLTCDVGTLACSEAQCLTTQDDANLDIKPIISKQNLLETDRQGPEICFTAVNGKERNSVLDDSDSPVAKRIKRGRVVEQGMEVIELMESDEGTEELLMDGAPSLGGVKSPLPTVDSTQAISPSVSIVTSSQPSPVRHKRVNVATQCDPEEIIVLTDSD